MDLHVHTCLSPCGDTGMVPTRIVKRALDAGLDVVAICDHNAVANVSSVQKAGNRKGLIVWGGIEITSREEIHVLALFDTVADLTFMNDLVKDHLTGFNDSRVFGEQWIVDSNDHIIGIDDRLLIGATELSIDRIVEATHDFNGVAIASHIDRESYSLIGQLGFIPAGLDLDAVEISPNGNRRNYESYSLPIVESSDAHFVEDIGIKATRARLSRASIEELRIALHDAVEGRFVFQ